MPKRSPDRPNLQSKYEKSRVDQSMYGVMEKEQLTKQRIKDKPQRHISPGVKSDLIRRDPSSGDKRCCYECECTNNQGFCDNYLLYAVMRDICKKPVQEAG